MSVRMSGIGKGRSDSNITGAMFGTTWGRWRRPSGAYDIVLIGEHPNDETAARAALTTGSLGNVRTETLRASIQ